MITKVIRIAELAGKELMRNFNEPHKIKLKLNKELVTEMDKKIELKIKKYLGNLYPDIGFLGEETGSDSGSSYDSTSKYWVVDPLDGTTNYSIKNPFFCVSIALVDNGVIKLGVVHSPVTKETFHAEKGKGAFLNGIPIMVSNIRSLNNSLMTYCNGRDPADIKQVTEYYSKIRPNVRDLRRIGAGALELAYVSVGRTESFFMNHMNPWDVAAGVLLVKEAGGKVTDFDNVDWDLTKNDVLASNGKSHVRLLELLWA